MKPAIITGMSFLILLMVTACSGILLQDTSLHEAAGSGNTEAIKALLEAGANVNAKGLDRHTPLHEAAYKGHAESIVLLLDAGANVHAVDRVYRYTPLLAATRHGSPESIKALLDAGADPNTLYYGLGVVSSITALFGDGPIITPLHEAARMGHTEAIVLLLEAGADVNTVSKGTYGYTPLHWAAERGHIEAAKILLEAGADVDTVEFRYYQTALDKAAFLKDYDMMWVLVDAGAKLHDRHLPVRTPSPTFHSELGRLQYLYPRCFRNFKTCNDYTYYMYSTLPAP